MGTNYSLGGEIAQLKQKKKIKKKARNDWLNSVSCQFLKKEILNIYFTF